MGGLRRFLLSGSGRLMGRATEGLATRTGPGTGGVPSVTFGTLPGLQLLALYAVLGIVLLRA